MHKASGKNVDRKFEINKVDLLQEFKTTTILEITNTIRQLKLDTRD